MEAVPDHLVTAATARYLFASEWLPCEPGEPTVPVPGGRVTGLTAAGNLLHVALWNLQRQGVIEFEQIRPVVKERVVVLGGRSFVRFRMLMPDAKLRGLESAVLRASRTYAEPDNWLTTKIRDAAGEEEAGLRDMLRCMSLDSSSPPSTVVGHCYAEAHAAGLVAVQGWLRQKVVIADAQMLGSQRAYGDWVRAERKAAMEREPVLHDAILADCLHAIQGAYSTGAD